MTHAFLLLGKAGDILSALPILKQRQLETGEPQNLVVAKAYKPIADRAPYVAPVAWTGDWQDLNGALKFAKRSFDRVTCLSTYGKEFSIQKRLPGFQLDQWDRAGMLEKWDQLPFELLNPACLARFDVDVTEKPKILFADFSESSPFPQADELATDLATVFPECQVIRLSAIRLENPCDMLALFDEAAALVTTETMFLHLSKFSKVPTVALVTDKPSRWHGSTWSKKFRLHVRYSDYEQRRVDIMQAVRDGLDKVEPPKIEPMPHAPTLSFNPSMMRVGDKLWTTWRTYPEKTSWRTELSLHDGEKTHPISIAGFDRHSNEDARLFMFKGEPHVSFTLARSSAQGASTCVVCYAKIKPGQMIAEFYRPQFGQQNWDGMEKNWCFFEHDGRLFCIYQCAPEQIVLGVDGNQVVSQHRSPSPECVWGTPRGGTSPLPFQGKWLRFVHCCQRNPKSDQWWTYMLLALVMEPTPPFRTVAISKRPILIGNEQYFPGNPHWKPRCVLPFGAIEEDGGWRVSIGVNDSQCATVKLTEKDLHL